MCRSLGQLYQPQSGIDAKPSLVIITGLYSSTTFSEEERSERSQRTFSSLLTCGIFLPYTKLVLYYNLRTVIFGNENL